MLFIGLAMTLGHLQAQDTSSQEPDLTYANAVAWSNDGAMIAVVGIRQPATQGYIRVIDVGTGQTLFATDPTPGGFTSVAWSPNDQFIAVGGYDQAIWIFDVAQQTYTTSLRGHASTVTAVDWNFDGTRLVSSGNWDGLTILWDMLNYEQLRIVEASGVFPQDVDFSINGEYIAIASELGIRIYRTVSETDENPLWYFRELNVASVEWSNAGSQLAFGTQTFQSETAPSRRAYAQVYVINWNTGEQVNAWTTQDQSIFDVNWSSDDNLLATASIDGFTRIWNVSSGSELNNYSNGITRYAVDINFSPFGGRLAYGGTFAGSELQTATTLQTNTDGSAQLAGGAVQIVVPAPSPERLQAITDACGLQPAADQALTAEISTQDYAGFTAQLEALPESALPPGCRADLLAVAAALEAQGQ
jgi:WD40 repeat protein